MSKCAASESHDDEPTSKCIRNHEGTRAPSLLADHGTWHILEQYLTTEMTYPQMEAAFASYLGNQYNTDDWKEAHDVLFSVVTLWKDSAISVSALKAAIRSKSTCVRRPKHPFIDDEASDDDDDEEEEAEEENSQVDGDDGPSMRSLNITCLQGPLSAKDRLSTVINHISNRYENAPSTCHRVVPSSSAVPSRMYLLHVHRSAMQCVAEHLRSNGIAVTISPWIPSQLYAVSDSPRTIVTSLKLLSSSVKDYTHILEEE
ncbi:uncharacterized protein BJ212DRAFT_1486921 [Suillus subaureus]|uniref:Uncharacterized protein n=1 Tax=Suillus subaureus TaxID=48587 RepID=A0A9P7J5G2_9AGAM|nr:uncharacterized protein BJ212DRAFT_1486921 [Suillus subaureus]KAG1803961.1 hypothetical protein BJ212DRAFT_1486921 [Suillus subaureus]